VPAFIVVPQAANPLKMQAIEQYGGQLVICDNSLEARASKLEEVRLQTHAREIPPYDDPLIIAGQGTAALELIDQVADLDSILVPVGGGGLLAGAVLAAKSTIKVYGAEPDQADDAYRSFHTGRRVLSHQPNTLCDGLLTTLGELNFEIISDGAEDILLVSETQIIESMEFIWRYLKQLVEPSSAVVLAAIIAHRDLFPDQNIGVVLTGGNVDYRNLPFSAPPSG
jgi:threonine dehydratase